MRDKLFLAKPSADFAPKILHFRAISRLARRRAEMDEAAARPSVSGIAFALALAPHAFNLSLSVLSTLLA